jgi:hypothetical protein
MAQRVMTYNPAALVKVPKPTAPHDATVGGTGAAAD